MPDIADSMLGLVKRLFVLLADESILNKSAPAKFLTSKALVELALFWNVVAPLVPIVATVVALLLKTAMLPAEVLLDTFKASPVVAPVKLVRADVTVNVLPAATKVLPLRLTLPVEVSNEPALPEALKLPLPWLYPVIPLNAPLLIIKLFIVLPDVAAVILPSNSRLVLKAPLVLPKLMVTSAAPRSAAALGRLLALRAAQVKLPLAAIVVANWLAEQSVGSEARLVAVEALPVKAPTNVAAVIVPSVVRLVTNEPLVLVRSIVTLEAPRSAPALGRLLAFRAAQVKLPPASIVVAN